MMRLKVVLKNIKNLIPKGFEPIRLMQITMNNIANNPDIADCDMMSIVTAIYQAAILGLEPGVDGQAYIVPFVNYKKIKESICGL